MQVYRGMDVGTAKPSAEERRQIPHHLLDLVSPAEPFTVVDWVSQAERVVGEVLDRRAIPLVVGGTGFYLRALARGLPTVPAADEQVQREIWLELEKNGLGRLQRELEEASPEDARRAAGNPRRVVRAVEILRRTGRPPADFPLQPPRYRCSLAVLEPPMESLRPRIVARTEEMFASGLVGEVEGLLELYPRQLTATQAIGYKEVARALSGETTLAQAKQEVTAATIRYARRQLTWFRRQEARFRAAALATQALPRLQAWFDETAMGLHSRRGPAP